MVNANNATIHLGAYLPDPSAKNPIRLLADQVPSQLARQDLELIVPRKRAVDGTRADAPAAAGNPEREHGPALTLNKNNNQETLGLAIQQST